MPQTLPPRLNPVLRRQLEAAGADASQPPTEAQWLALLGRLDRAFHSGEHATASAAGALAAINHQLRTPLNVIMGYSELLQEEAVGTPLEPFSADLARIQEAALHLLALFDAALEQARTGPLTTEDRCDMNPGGA